MKKWIPNFLTTANLFLGLAGIVAVFEHRAAWGATCIIAAALLDFLDGFTARLLNAQSSIGKQLDTLADMVSFGVLPGVIAYQLLNASAAEGSLLPYVAFSLPVCAAWRLAKFNTDDSQTSVFSGMPTPAVAVLMAGFPLALEVQYNLNMYHQPTAGALDEMAKLWWWTTLDVDIVIILFDYRFLTGLVVMLSFLMISPIRFISFKFSSWRWAENKWRYATLIAAVACLLLTFFPYWIRIKGMVFLDYLVIPLIVFLYIVFSIIQHFITHDKVSSSH